MNNTTSSENLYNGHCKDTKKKTQLRRFYECLLVHPFTCSHASEILGIPQKSLCRLKRRLERSGLLWEVKRVKCPVTNHWAYLLTTNPAEAPMCNQLKLFCYGDN